MERADKAYRTLRLLRLRRRLNGTAGIRVKTWCRVCAQPVVLDVPQNFDSALRYLYSLDDRPMVHREGGHYEPTNWGIHWRFDSVLIEVFGDMYHAETDMPYWPVPPWYEHDTGVRNADILSIDQAVGEDAAYSGRVISR